MPQQSKTPVDDPFRGRRPISHEQIAGVPWDASYIGGPAPWDIGHPQPAIVRLAGEGRFTGSVLDAGCGTGENTLHIASLGVPVLGVDVAETAITLARKKALDRASKAEFLTADALHLELLERNFDTVLDSALFHTFNQEEQTAYAKSLSSVTKPGGPLYVLCFSNEGPDTGPHPVSQEDLKAAFHAESGWRLISIQAERVGTRFHDFGAPAWLATIKRINRGESYE